MPSVERRKPLTGKPPLPKTIDIFAEPVAGVVDPRLPASDFGELGRAATPATETVFGLTLSQLHARFWAARGVQVIQ